MIELGSNGIIVTILKDFGGLGMAKIICDCGSSFPIEKVKGLKACPICGASFDDFNNGEDSDYEDGLMYFDEIATSYKEHPEYNGVRAYCGECGKDNSLELDKFDKFKDKEYVILKENITVKCRGCGKEHKPRKILYKRKDSYAPPLPRCPICNSAMLKKIKTSSKFLAAATVGMFALPYNSKTFECKDCGYRF